MSHTASIKTMPHRRGDVMKWELVLTKAVFTELYRRLAGNPTRVSVCPAGLARLPDRHTGPGVDSGVQRRRTPRRGEPGDFGRGL
jgi:hypothetical protein